MSACVQKSTTRKFACVVALLAGVVIAMVSAVPAGATTSARQVPAGAGKGAVPPLSSHGRWFTDAAGRTVQLRGVNEVYKHAPYYPAADGFGSDDAALLADNGFNVVRLGIDFRGLLPAPGAVQQDYIDQLATTVDELSDKGIYVLLDFHQDGFSPKYNGNGFPDWWAIDDGADNPDVEFPLYYVLNPAMQRAWDHFWMNSEVSGKGIQDWFIDGLTAVVKRFRSDEHVIGYEAFNEPWPGTDFVSCFSPEAGCPDLEQSLMVPFAEKVVAATRKLTKRQPVFIEPFVQFNFGTPTTLPGSTGAWLSAHDYASSREGDATVVKQAADAATRDGKPVMLTEFGATNDGDQLNYLTGLYDQSLMPWIFWAYNENVVTDGTVPATTEVANQTVLRALTRPYPVAIAGRPTQFSFDPASKVMSLQYKTRRPGGGKYPTKLPSVVAVQRLTYPEGYTVKVKGAKVASKPCAQRLKLRKRGKAKSVSVTVTPGGACS